jgi:4-amino-4-deoxy-L-arabinose transferase-like glycosyltransferase
MRTPAFIGAVLALAIIAMVRVAATHEEYAATLDEPIHLASGFEWFDGNYATDMTHPPLARIVCALPLRLAGYPAPKPAGMVDRGNQLLYHGERYEQTLALARRGNLLFLLLAIAVVAAWARRAFGNEIALIAVALFTNLPIVLGHAGVITTDMALTATLPLSLFALDLFAEKRTWRRAVFLGIALGLAMLSKFSFIVFFPACALIVILSRADGEGSQPRRPRILRSFAPLRMTGGAFAIALLVVWAGYRFDIRRPATVIENGANMIDWAAPAPLKPLARTIAQWPLPATELVLGLAQVKLHDTLGHGGYLLGREYTNGWWPYFAVLLFYKSPLPWLILVAWGLRYKRTLPFALIAAAILILASTSKINIGLRHVLPLFAPLSIVAAVAVHDIRRHAQTAFSKAALLALLLWFAGGVAIDHPDYLPWFNELAQPTPSQISVDSNLDWGQDVLRLARVVRERNIPHLYTAFFTPMRLGVHGISATGLAPNMPVQGWVAISEHQIRFTEDTGDYDWLQKYRPVAMVGESIRLYYVPE